MFFSKDPENNRLGQIFPVLILVLVGFVIAVGITKMTGEGAKANTSAANSADAASMAVASFQAGAFNKLVDRNKNVPTSGDNFGQYMKPEDRYWYYKRMRFYFEEMKKRYDVLRLLGNNYLTDFSADNAQYYINEAITELIAVEVDYKKPIVNCTLADGMLDGWYHCANAIGLLKKAKLCIAAYYVCASYMLYITDWFKAYQTSNFCEAKAFMQGPDEELAYPGGYSYPKWDGTGGGCYKKSVEAGQQYGLNNSAIMSMLPEGLGDDFTFQLGTGALFGGANVANNTATYSWGEGAGACSVSVEVKTPNIDNYYLKSSNWNWPKEHVYHTIDFWCIPLESIPVVENVVPFDITSADVLYQQLEIVRYYIEHTLANWGYKAYMETVSGKACCDRCDNDPFAAWNCKDECYKHFDEARRLQTEVLPWVPCVYGKLGTVANLSGWDEAGGPLTIPVLKIRNNEYNWNNLWVKQEVPKPIRSCTGIKIYDDEETKFSGMMLIEIDNVKLKDEWKSKATATASCAGSATTKVSTSKFWGDSGGRGENIGEPGGYNDDYYPEILEAN